MSDNSIFNKQIDPFKQAAIIYLGSMMFTFLFKIFDWTGMAPQPVYLPYVMTAAGILFFALFNSVLSLAFKDQNAYWLRSIMAFVSLMILGSLTSWLISGVPLGEAMSFKWLYIVFTIGYVVFLVIVRLMRKIVLIAKKQDARLRGEE